MVVSSGENKSLQEKTLTFHRRPTSYNFLLKLRERMHPYQTSVFRNFSQAFILFTNVNVNVKYFEQ